jgi:hypothetical protein
MVKPRKALGGWWFARAQVEVMVAAEERAIKFNETRLFSRRFAYFLEKTVVSDRGTRLCSRRGRVFPRETRFYEPHRWGPPEPDFFLGGSRVSKRKQGRRAIGSTGWGLRVEGWGLRVEGWGLRVEGWGLRVEGWGLRVEGW